MALCATAEDYDLLAPTAAEEWVIIRLTLGVSDGAGDIAYLCLELAIHVPINRCADHDHIHGRHFS